MSRINPQELDQLFSNDSDLILAAKVADALTSNDDHDCADNILMLLGVIRQRVEANADGIWFGLDLLTAAVFAQVTSAGKHVQPYISQLMEPTTGRRAKR
jgi:hypothetical protein